MPDFARARTPAQRLERRQLILDTAAAMLADTDVRGLTLTGLSDRVGLAKSNVLRYFESREEILLELLGLEARRWLADLPAVEVDPEPSFANRAEQLAETLAKSLAARPMLCGLLAARTSVLETNISAEVAVHHRRESIHTWHALARYVAGSVPDLGTTGAKRIAAALLIIAAGVWSNSQPSAAMKAAFESAPDIESTRSDFSTTMHELVATLTFGEVLRADGRRSTM